MAVAADERAAAEASSSSRPPSSHAGSGAAADSLTALGNYLQAQLALLQAQNNADRRRDAILAGCVGVSGRVAAIDDSSFYAHPPALDTAAMRTGSAATAPALTACSKPT